MHATEKERRRVREVKNNDCAPSNTCALHQQASAFRHTLARIQALRSMVKGPGSSARISAHAMRSPTFDSKRSKIVSVSSPDNGNGVQQRTPMASPRSMNGEVIVSVRIPLQISARHS